MSDPIELPPAYRMLWLGYLDLFRRRLGTHAMVNGYYGSELPEPALRAVINELTNEMKLDCHLSEDQHLALKGKLLDTIFGSTRKQWVKQ